MRQRHTTQRSIFSFAPEHDIGTYLARVSDWLDSTPEVLDWIAKDLRAGSTRGRPGMSCEQVLRAAISLQYRQCGFRGLEFLLKDSLSFQHFCRVDPLRPPSKSCLAANIRAIRPSTWRKVHLRFVQDRKLDGFETGERLRIGSTVAETHILFPTDSKLLYDAIRLMVRTLRNLKPLVAIKFVNHSRRAKRHWFAATMAKTDAQRYPHYRALLRDTDETRLKMIDALETAKLPAPRAEAIRQLLHRVSQVMAQTTRRVVLGETVPAEDKVVSLHEPHSDIILKGGRDVQFGHKLNLSTGRSGLVIDLSIERGNPSDQGRLPAMLRRHRRVFGEMPQALAADGGYATLHNLRAAKSMGIGAVAFDKRVNLSIDEMTGDDWLYRELKRFRAGIEASISYLKRCFGMGRILWRGWHGFQSNHHLSVLTHNLIVWARTG